MSTIDKNYTGSAHSHRGISADLLFRDEPEDEEEEDEDDDEKGDERADEKRHLKAPLVSPHMNALLASRFHDRNLTLRQSSARSQTVCGSISTTPAPPRACS